MREEGREVARGVGLVEAKEEEAVAKEEVVAKGGGGHKALER